MVKRHACGLCSDPADKHRWGVALYLVSDEAIRMQPSIVASHDLRYVEDRIDDFSSYYARRPVASIAKLAVAVEHGWQHTLRTLWRWGLYEAPHISQPMYRRWWFGISPFPWRGGLRRRHGRS